MVQRAGLAYITNSEERGVKAGEARCRRNT
jgi:hypothetical protein